ncbi:MAG: TetR/AcrR family transcriptional regulator [Selenomonadaceae bacterium]|nr:TetR/AcrR family transcriptional regulator [Selenomonadaceae bacterium]
MPRPKKSNQDEMAVTRIEKAFWQLLETEDYSNITVLRISQESGTNRNSFYYHYRNIDDLAHKAFMRNANNDVSKALIAALMSHSCNGNEQSAPIIAPAVLQHSKRIMLCARSNSPYLNHLVHDLLQKIWFDAMSIKEELLSAEEKVQVRFVFAGLVAVLGSQEIKDCPLLMSSLSQTEIGKAFIAALERIALGQQSP